MPNHTQCICILHKREKRVLPHHASSSISMSEGDGGPGIQHKEMKDPPLGEQIFGANSNVSTSQSSTLARTVPYISYGP